jgi:hypothetical protein
MISIGITCTGVCGLFCGSLFFAARDALPVRPYMTPEKLKKIDAEMIESGSDVSTGRYIETEDKLNEAYNKDRGIIETEVE